MANKHYIEIMKAGGATLGTIRDTLVADTRVGDSFAQIEERAQQLIGQAGYKPSFSTVPGYHWATCIMKNDELCHGIPSEKKRVESGDIVTIDIGLLADGYHLDTTHTFAVGKVSDDVTTFLEKGEAALYKSIAKAKVGNSVYDVSSVMHTQLDKAGYGAVYQLTGHGIGRELHMEPSIPVVRVRGDKRKKFKPGQTVAIEIMYTTGDPTVEIDADGWTFRTKDGGLSGMFEHTVLITQSGPQILTKAE